MTQIKRETLWNFLFFVMMAVTMLAVRAFRIREMIQLLFILVSFGKLKLNRGGKFDFLAEILIGRIIFLTWCACSYFWALYPNVVWNYMVSVAQSTLLMCAVVIYFSQNTKVHLKYGIQMFLFMSFVLAVMVLVTTSLQELISGTAELKERISVRGINANQIGVCCSYSILMLFGCDDGGKAKRVIVGIPMLLVALLTGSKKALITLIVGGCILAIAKTGNLKNMIKALLAVILFSICLLWAIYHVDFLYQISGKRVDGLLLYLMTGTGDKSTTSRAYMVQLASELFLEHPMLGIGLHNFKSVNRYGVYAHNNFMELLACLGLPGFLLYYGVLARELCGEMRHFSAHRGSANFALVLLLCFLINEYATVSYTNEVIQLVLGLILGFAFCYPDEG